MTDFSRLPMRVAVGQFQNLTSEMIQFIRQMGVKDIQLNMYAGGCDYLRGEKQWEYIELVNLRSSIEDAGFRLNALENVPTEFYDKVMLGKPGRDEQIEHMQNTVRNIGRAGIPFFGYHFMPSKVWRTSNTARARGDAYTTAFDMALAEDAPLTHDRVYTEEELWDNYAYYMRAILPVAEEAGVKMALHPDDPPVEVLGGVPRLMRSFEAFKRAMDVVDSPSHGMNFCVGTWSEMGPDVNPERVLEAIRYFGSRGKIFYGHFRDVKGVVPKFREAFVDEDEGNLDMFVVMKTLYEVGFRGFLIDDHVPEMVNHKGWISESRAFATGQMIAWNKVIQGNYYGKAA